MGPADGVAVPGGPDAVLVPETGPITATGAGEERLPVMLRPGPPAAPPDSAAHAGASAHAAGVHVLPAHRGAFLQAGVRSRVGVEGLMGGGVVALAGLGRCVRLSSVGSGLVSGGRESEGRAAEVSP